MNGKVLNIQAKIIRLKGGQKMVWTKERGKVHMYAHPLDLFEDLYTAELMWMWEVFRRCEAPFNPNRYDYSAHSWSKRDIKSGYDAPKYRPGYSEVLRDGIWTFYRKSKKVSK